MNTFMIPTWVIAAMAANSIAVKVYSWKLCHWTPLVPFLLRFAFPPFCVMCIFIYGTVLPMDIGRFAIFGRIGFVLFLLPDLIVTFLLLLGVFIQPIRRLTRNAL